LQFVLISFSFMFSFMQSLRDLLEYEESGFAAMTFIKARTQLPGDRA
jgi:hypothetical protein